MALEREITSTLLRVTDAKLSNNLAHLALMTPSPEHAIATIRHLARRLERKLAALGNPNVLETCERRGYRLREVLTLTR
ncbi:hypothetical protein BH11MYX2_BH11MYX2_20370 [soil metagenome]